MCTCSKPGHKIPSASIVIISMHNEDYMTSQIQVRVIVNDDSFSSPVNNFSALSWKNQVKKPFWLYGNDICFVPVKHTSLNLHIAGLLKQQPAGRHVAPLGH